jgi:hypothetical protein
MTLRGKDKAERGRGKVTGPPPGLIVPYAAREIKLSDPCAVVRIQSIQSPCDILNNLFHLSSTSPHKIAPKRVMAPLSGRRHCCCLFVEPSEEALGMHRDSGEDSVNTRSP